MAWRYHKHIVPIARNLRKTATDAETALWNIVRGRKCDGFRFVRQYPVGPFVLDFYCPAVRLAVEVDGGVHDEIAVQKRDIQRQENIENDFGIAFVRVTNTDVLSNSEDVAARIAAACRKCEERITRDEKPASRRG